MKFKIRALSAVPMLLAILLVAPRPLTAQTVAQAPSAAEVSRLIDWRMKIALQPIQYLYDGATPRDLANIVAIDLYNFRSTQVRELYDQNYYASLQYQSRVVQTLSQARRSLAAGEVADAYSLTQRATFSLRQLVIAQSTAAAIGVEDIESAARNANTFKIAGELASILVGGVGSPAQIVLLNGVNYLGELAADTLKDGFTQASRNAAARALTQGLVMLVPIPELNGLTISEAVEQSKLVAMADPTLQRVLRSAVSNPATRNKLIQYVVSVLGKAGLSLTQFALAENAKLIVDAFTDGASAQPTGPAPPPSTIPVPLTPPARPPEITAAPTTVAQVPLSVVSMSADGATAIEVLGSLKEADRYSALAALSRANKIRGPLTATDTNRITAGMGSHQSMAVALLAPLVADNATASDIASILGKLMEADRYSALAALSRANKIRGPLTATDANRITAGMGSHQSMAVALLAPFVADSATGSDIASILGQLMEANRYSALAALSRANKIRGPLTATDANRITAGMGSYQSMAVALLATSMR